MITKFKYFEISKFQNKKKRTKTQILSSFEF